MSSKIGLGLFGFGCVGQGLYSVLQNATGYNASIPKIGIKNPEKVRSLNKELFTTYPEEVISHPEVDVIVELIDDAEAALGLVTQSLKAGKSVVTANKKMLANNLQELIELQQATGGSLLYEASACGSIPIIRNLEEYYDNEPLKSISGIFNGSSNYILSKMFNEGLDYPTALKQAQDLGFAESNPALDVLGYDAKFKLVILILHAFGVIVKPEDVFNAGIATVSPFDFDFATKKGWKIKLLNHAFVTDKNELVAYTIPSFVDSSNQLYNVENEYNGVLLKGAFSEWQFLQGKGAGGSPTGSAVLSDISALSYGYRYQYKKLNQKHNVVATNNHLITCYISFKDEEQLNHLDFWDIQERFYTEEHSYVIGRLKLADLLKANQIHLEREVFLAVLPTP